MQAIAPHAIEAYRRERFLESANAAFEALRKDPKTWRQEQEERAEWEAGLEGMAMSLSTVKERILEAIEKLPPDASVEDAIERLVFLAKIERERGELTHQSVS